MISKIVSKNSLIFFITFSLLTALLIKVYPPAAPTDTFYHLSVGRQVYQEKKIPHEDNFIYAPEDRKITSVEWLSGLIFFIFVKFFGLKGLYIPRLIFGLITFYYLFKSIRIFTSDIFLISATALSTGYIIAFRFNDRPEIMSLAFLSIINFVCPIPSIADCCRI